MNELIIKFNAVMSFNVSLIRNKELTKAEKKRLGALAEKVNKALYSEINNETIKDMIVFIEPLRQSYRKLRQSQIILDTELKTNTEFKI